MDIGPIPLSAIERWADRRRLTDPDEFESFHKSIRAMERVLINHKPRIGAGDKTPPANANAPLTPEAFDAMFVRREPE